MRKFLMALLIMGAIQWSTMAGATAATVIREDFSRYFDGLTARLSYMSLLRIPIEFITKSRVTKDCHPAQALRFSIH